VRLLLALIVLVAVVGAIAVVLIPYLPSRKERKRDALSVPPDQLPAVTRYYYNLSSDAVDLLAGMLRDDDNLSVFYRADDKRQAQLLVRRFRDRREIT